MTQPTPQQVAVATNALRTEANEWETQAALLGNLAAKVEGMELSRVEAGLFQLIVSPYNDVVHQVQFRCQEGRTAMGQVATALRSAADTYEREDDNNAHRIHNRY